MSKQQPYNVVPLNSVVISIKEHEKLLKYKEAAQQNMIAVYFGSYGTDCVSVQTKDKAIESLSDVIKLQKEHIEKLEEDLREERKKVFELDPKNNLAFLVPNPGIKKRLSFFKCFFK